MKSGATLSSCVKGPSPQGRDRVCTCWWTQVSQCSGGEHWKWGASPSLLCQEECDSRCYSPLPLSGCGCHIAHAAPPDVLSLPGASQVPAQSDRPRAAAPCPPVWLGPTLTPSVAFPGGRSAPSGERKLAQAEGASVRWSRRSPGPGHRRTPSPTHTNRWGSSFGGPIREVAASWPPAVPSSGQSTALSSEAGTRRGPTPVRYFASSPRPPLERGPASESGNGGRNRKAS